MPLTRRTDGTQAANRVYASWFNDFMDLLTGVMTDQPVTLANSQTITRQGSTSGSTNLLYLKTTVSAAHQYNVYVGFDGSLGIWDNDNSKAILANATGTGLSLIPSGGNFVVGSLWATLKGHSVAVMRGFGGAPAGLQIWVMTGATDPTAADGLAEGDLVFKY